MPQIRAKSFLAIEPNGSTFHLPLNNISIKAGLHGAHLDAVMLPDDSHVMWVGDESILTRQALNVPVSIFSGMALWGPAVLTGLADETGDPLPPLQHAVSGLTAMANLWARVHTHAGTLGQSIDVHADPGRLPAPRIVEMTDGEITAWIMGDVSNPDLTERIINRMRWEDGQ